MTDQAYHGVWIEIRKVQDYIFDTPKLKVMLGANSLIGELLFQDLRELAESYFLMNKKIDALQVNQPDDVTIDIDKDNPWAAFQKHILNYFGGHFQAVFLSYDCARNFAEKARNLAQTKVPGLTMDCFVFPI
ncbi:MAG: hypothetical protein HQM12_21080, partial [SAR324 cluster bacterium]|nr:hypothetical protein [SAR324 cluster bacterium]